MKHSGSYNDGYLTHKRLCYLAGPETPSEPEEREEQQVAPEKIAAREIEEAIPENIEETIDKVKEVDQGFEEKVSSLVGSANETELALAKEFVDKPMLSAFFEQHEELRRGAAENRKEVLSGIQAAQSPVERPPENA